MNRLLLMLSIASTLFATGARADDRGAVSVLQEVLQQLVIMNGKVDALNGKLDTINNRAYGANGQEHVFVFTLPGSFQKGPKEDGRALCANLGGALRGAYSYGGQIIVSCNY